MCASQGHGADVNVISWNHLVNYLVVSGADDGSMRIWDLRSLSSGQPVARFHWHKAAITSVEWSPHESSTIAASAADDQLSLWDLALEVRRDHAGSRRDHAEITPRCTSRQHFITSTWHAMNAPQDDPEADIAVEGRDDLRDLPPQLYFVHQGQSEMKELHWHPQLPGKIARPADPALPPGTPRFTSAVVACARVPRRRSCEHGG